jgi:hypothetical protein
MADNWSNSPSTYFFNECQLLLILIVSLSICSPTICFNIELRRANVIKFFEFFCYTMITTERGKNYDEEAKQLCMPQGIKKSNIKCVFYFIFSFYQICVLIVKQPHNLWTIHVPMLLAEILQNKVKEEHLTIYIINLHCHNIRSKHTIILHISKL